MSDSAPKPAKVEAKINQQEWWDRFLVTITKARKICLGRYPNTSSYKQTCLKLEEEHCSNWDGLWNKLEEIRTMAKPNSAGGTRDEQISKCGKEWWDKQMGALNRANPKIFGTLYHEDSTTTPKKSLKRAADDDVDFYGQEGAGLNIIEIYNAREENRRLRENRDKELREKKKSLKRAAEDDAPLKPPKRTKVVVPDIARGQVWKRSDALVRIDSVGLSTDDAWTPFVFYQELTDDELPFGMDSSYPKQLFPVEFELLYDYRRISLMEVRLLPHETSVFDFQREMVSKQPCFTTDLLRCVCEHVLDAVPHQRVTYNHVWVDLELSIYKRYKVTAKVYDEPSEHGIHFDEKGNVCTGELKIRVPK